MSKFLSIFNRVKTWQDLEARIAALPTEKDRGDAFEDFCEGYIVLNQEYGVKKIWQHGKIPSEVIKELGLVGQKDLGIDFVVETKDDKLWAIQAKFRSNREDSVPYRELSTALAISDKADYRLILTNTLSLPPAVHKRKNVGQVLVDGFDNLSNEFFKDLYKYLSKKVVVYLKPKNPKPHQRIAIKKAVSHFKSNSRGQLIMACATGKTLTALWIAERLKAKNILVMVPSLELLRQTLSVWAKNTSVKPFSYLCLCSDVTVGSELERGEKPDHPHGHLWELDIPVTTEAREVKLFIDKKAPGGVKVIFSTYQSGNVLVKALKTAKKFYFDFTIYDEAHRTAGIGKQLFSITLDDRNMLSKKRMFMTATPKLLAGHVKRKGLEEDIELCSMDDERLYGKRIHHLGFKEAIKRKLLTDYKIAIIAVTDKELQDLIKNKKTVVRLKDIRDKERNAQNLAKQVALIKAMAKFEARHIISFHSRVKWAEALVDPESPFSMQDVVAMMIKTGYRAPPLLCRHVNGEMTSAIRNKLINEFAMSKHGIISNARCLTEGVDVPIVDGVYFFDPKYRLIDIVQATGRALRLYKGKKYGYIVIPVVINKNESIENVISGTDFVQIWNVINAMEDQDERLEEIISRIRIEDGKITGGGKISSVRKSLEETLFERVALIDFPRRLLAKDFVNKLRIQLVERAGHSWDFMYGLLISFRKKHPGRWPVPTEVFKGIKLGSWCVSQRQRKKLNILSETKIASLNKIEFPWDPRRETWDRVFLCLKDFRKENPNRWPGAYEVYNGSKIGIWCSTQRKRKKLNLLSNSKITRLSKINFPWDSPHNKAWSHAFSLLKDFRSKNPSKWPKQITFYKGITLGRWCNQQRRLKKIKQLPKDRIAELDQLGFPWDPKDESWEKVYNYLKDFRKKNPDDWPNISRVHKRFKLGRWCSNQRSRKSTLPEYKIRKLNEIDFPWAARKDAWVLAFSVLRNFRKKYPYSWPIGSEKFKNFILGDWCTRQRQAKKKRMLPKDCIRKLNRLGFPWAPKDESWERSYNFLKEFRKKNPDIWPGYEIVYKKVKLGQWCSTQRVLNNRARLEKDRIKKLGQIGFPWVPKDDTWEYGFNNLINFRKQNPSRWPKNGERYNGLNIGQWCITQRSLKKRAVASLSRDRVMKLNHLGFPWVAHREGWECAFKLLKEFRNDNNRWPSEEEVYHGFKLGAWCGRQRQLKKINHLSSDKECRLHQINFSWTPLQDRWEYCFALLEEFRKKNPNRWPKQREVYKGLNLGSWHNNQREARKYGSLSADRIKKLDQIGFQWNPHGEQWEAAFRLLKEFRKKNPIRWPGHNEVYQHFKLGTWCNNQRRRKKRREIPMDRIEGLDKMGFPWAAK